MTVYAFVPGYDKCTWANETLANQLPSFSNGTNIIHGQIATRKSFWSLVQPGQHILAMSHGDYDVLCAQGGFEYAITVTDIQEDRSSIKECFLFIWACRTAGKLGRAFRSRPYTERQGMWWGYPVTVSAPDKQVFSQFIKVFTFIVEAFPRAKDIDGVNFFREELRRMCEPIYQQLVLEAARSKKYTNLHETAVAFREMYEYLEVSFADGQMVSSYARPLSAIW